ncbi:HEAT repeat domain-containing protein [Streptomyces sp. NPDC093225]|uniref:HEAT repeat domain-containing protein n=1 Tax=Streptomyces sp. NPDC093225 TaxID=3366034 RepID=UPI0037F7D522
MSIAAVGPGDADGDAVLLAAVRSGDADAVRALLAAGADPEAADGSGLPALCPAVAAFDEEVAEALVDGGADPYRRLPDGSTPLLRAVDSGYVGVAVWALSGGDPQRIRPDARAELLARARPWSEHGTEAELRRRTGATGPAVRTRFEDRRWWTAYEEVTLGGVTVRDGHAAVLTQLEEQFGVRAPFDELMDRALVRPDPDHVGWSTVTGVLAKRHDDETWAAALALRTDPEPRRRIFGAEVLWLMAGGIVAPAEPFERRAHGVFLAWAGEEEHPDVLRSVLLGLNDHSGPEVEAAGLAFAAHPDPRLRGMVLGSLDTDAAGRLGPGAVAAVRSLARDPDAGVRAAVCGWLSEHSDREPWTADVLAGLLHEEDQMVRIHAVFGLALRDDPRCVAGERLIGPVDRARWPDTWMLDGVRGYEERRRAAD